MDPAFEKAFNAGDLDTLLKLYDEHGPVQALSEVLFAQSTLLLPREIQETECRRQSARPSECLQQGVQVARVESLLKGRIHVSGLRRQRLAPTGGTNEPPNSPSWDQPFCYNGRVYENGATRSALPATGHENLGRQLGICDR